MTDNKFSFYLQSNNSLFNGNILTICYMADKKEISKYGLTSPNIVLFIKDDKISEIKSGSDCNYYSEIKKMFVDKKILLRIQSECFLGVYGDSHCDCESQRISAVKLISQVGGIFVHLPQEAQGWGLHYKLKELELQVSGRTPFGEYVGKKDRDSAQKMLLNVHNFSDNRGYGILAEIFKKLGIDKNTFLVITDSDKKVKNLSETGINFVKYSDDISKKINADNVSEYLIKICNLTHNFDDEIIDLIIKTIEERKYNERTLLTFVNIIDKIKNDSTYQLDDKIKKKFLNLYDNIICGEEKRYIIGDEKYVKLQNNFSCKVDSSIFKTLCKIYGRNIFDRISLEKIYYFQNIVTGESVRVRSSKILDNIEKVCCMFNGQSHIEQSTYCDEKRKVVQKEISASSLRAYFENPEYIYQKRVEMVTIISESIIPELNIYIKRIPNIENRVMDVFGKSENIRNLINMIIKCNNRTLLNIISDRNLSERNFSQYNLRFADLNSVIDEEMDMYTLTKGE